MMNPREFGEQVCTALGLEPKQVAGLCIDILPNEWPRITVTRYVLDMSVARQLTDAVRDMDFTLHPSTEPTVTESFDFKPKEPNQ